MKNFRLLGAALLVVVLMLAGCGNAEGKTRTFVMENPGAKETQTYTYTDDKIEKQTVEMYLNFADAELDEDEEITAEEINEFFEMFENMYEDVDGITVTTDAKDTEGTVTISIDFTEMKEEDLNDLMLATDGDPSEGFSMEETAQGLLDAGYTEQE